MFISTIIPTIGRSTLSRAVQSVLNQQFEREPCEIIVVNDSGQELAVEEWQSHPYVRVISTNRLNRSIARNTGAAIAKGRYLHFLDDDDWMLPGAFEAFWQVAENRPAAWYCGAFRLTNPDGQKFIDVFPDEAHNCFVQLVSWEWLPLQASIIEADAFFKMGGFAMLESLKGGFEDIDLSRMIACYYDFMNVPDLVACIRAGGNGSTTNYADMFIQNRESREKALTQPGAFQRLLSSARHNVQRREYWYGRIIYEYVGSAQRNVREKRLFTSMSRMLHALCALLVATSCFFSRNFWLGITQPHRTRVWIEAVNSGKELFTNIIKQTQL
jgi:glycosyltransferase involved in cell wall biosynthesis